ncbi:O-antigen ligase family protein [Rugosimonospora africana]|nr:O-antigen ligase family protein [Rugosimonospora africana]
MGSQQAAVMLQAFAVAAFVLPTDTVIRVIGAQGYVASLIAMLLLAAWIVTAIFGYHDPLHTRYPIRGALALMWICTLLSYAAMPFYVPDESQRLGAGRWLMLWAGTSGVVLVAAEHLRSMRDVHRVVRVIVWGGAFSGFIAVFQFWLHWDLKPYLRQLLVGFERNGDYSGFQGRDALVRVTGMANHPIEFGVVAGMLLPLAIWLGLYGRQRSALRRWLPLVLIGMCIPMSVSRSAILASVTSVGVLVVALPVAERARVILFTPVAVVGVFASTPGYLRTMYGLFTAGSTDPSVANRLNNYPRVLAAVQAHPWLGAGGGTDIQTDLTKVLDNQYLKSAIELGLVGVLALILYLVVPMIAMVQVAVKARDPEFRALCAALAGAALAAAVASYTFDSFSFAQFASVHALVVGLCGTCWLHAHRPPSSS